MGLLEALHFIHCAANSITCCLLSLRQFGHYQLPGQLNLSLAVSQNGLWICNTNCVNKANILHFFYGYFPAVAGKKRHNNVSHLEYVVPLIAKCTPLSGSLWRPVLSLSELCAVVWFRVKWAPVDLPWIQLSSLHDGTLSSLPPSSSLSWYGPTWYSDCKIAPFGHPAVMVGTELLIFHIWLFPSVPFPVTFTPKGCSRLRACPAEREILWSGSTLKRDSSPDQQVFVTPKWLHLDLNIRNTVSSWRHKGCEMYTLLNTHYARGFPLQYPLWSRFYSHSQMRKLRSHELKWWF